MDQKHELRPTHAQAAGTPSCSRVHLTSTSRLRPARTEEPRVTRRAAEQCRWTDKTTLLIIDIVKKH
jgi:hypothetical protein